MMERLIHSRLIRILSIALMSTAALYGLMKSAPASAGAYPNLDEVACMADAYLMKPGNSLPQDALNCTANDVEITQVTPTNPNEECTPGQVFSFNADVTIRTNANERYDTTFYLPLTEDSPKVVQDGGDNCSMILPIPGDSGYSADVELDGDVCGDISKAAGEDTYVLENETITMLCADEDGDNRADFTYCAAWDNIERNNCTLAEDPYPGQIPNTKSKCNCDTFNIDVFIKPTPPVIVKSEGTPTTRSEPGGTYTFNLSFTNPNSQTSLYLSSVTDEIDINGDGSYDKTLNLWGATSSPGGDGVYLTATNCTVGSPLLEIAPSGTYSCQFTVHIVDTDLPDDQSPELYKDVVKVTMQDKNGDAVTNGETCPAGVGTSAAGEHCSVERTVQVTNIPPTITVVKTANTDEVLEPGANVTYTVTVTNTSQDFDSPVQLTTLTDTIGAVVQDLDGIGTCATGGYIVNGAMNAYTCTFTQYVGGDQGESVTNVVKAVAIDNESDEAMHSDSWTVSIRDVPSVVELIKEANPTSVDETGDDPTVYRDVEYTFTFSVKTVDSMGNPTVDDVTFDKLDDDKFGDLTSQCSALPVTLSPGQSDSCTITLQLQGNAGDEHVNVATIYGTDEDGLMVSDDDDAMVTFLDLPLQLTPEFAMKATAFVRIVNGNVDNMTITTMNFDGVPVLDGSTDGSSFVIENNAAMSSYDAVVAPDFCTTGTVLIPGDVYECAFTLKLLPGFDPADGSINLLNDLDIQVSDDEGNIESSSVGIQIVTNEPALAP
ncbi:hypothetical protein [Vibrio sp. ABG19]|uniref:hypothetical protein n=1 Tax=Vibrio sp. ABG19 TaxID=2817385 RepID=UPI00249F3B90|nr:hypothetical protein [Vibrio sp. ABG19]WGY45280.1 hypothetical protein J0X00_06210 [Vibrio sp. ABG19]